MLLNLICLILCLWQYKLVAGPNAYSHRDQAQALVIRDCIVPCHCPSTIRFGCFQSLCYGFESFVQYHSCCTNTFWQAPWMDPLVFNFISIPIFSRCSFLFELDFSDPLDTFLLISFLMH